MEIKTFAPINKEHWIEEKTYWLHKYPQLSPEWFRERKFRLTVTKYNPIVNPSVYCDQEDVVKNYQGIEPEKTIQSQVACDFGIKTEPYAREWYEKTYQQDVRQAGLAVPKWDPRLGASVDGFVGEEGIIEIKCPLSMYYAITKYQMRRKEGWVPDKGYHGHIFDSHYDQMQGNMAITGRQWCDYIIYCPNENKEFVERIYFDPSYWNDLMYPKITKFLEKNKELFEDLRKRYIS
jgi:hypothetical protein